jgi:hypothetical protein
MLEHFISKRILRRFYTIELTNYERKMADGAVTQKYAPAVATALGYAVLLVPALLLLDTGIVVSVLIPTTMVAGTAWFAVSLASMKKKFEDFGMELTKHLFEAFALSLTMLFMATLASLTAEAWRPLIPQVANHWTVHLGAAILAIVVVGKLLYSIFAGSLKYDINDAMLTGQNEAAERFFKQSLSLLHTTSHQLRQGMPLQVANYSLGLAFHEVFENVREIHASAIGDDLVKRADKLILRPAMKQEEADRIVFSLIESFMAACSPRQEVVKNRSFKAIKDELECLEANAEVTGSEKEEQGMVDTRMAIVFSEMSNLIEEFGPSLFELREEMGDEKKRVAEA